MNWSAPRYLNGGLRDGTRDCWTQLWARFAVPKSPQFRPTKRIAPLHCCSPTTFATRFAKLSVSSRAAKLGEPALVGDLQITLHKGTEGAPQKNREYELTVHSLENVVAKVGQDLEVITQRRTGGVEPSKVVTLKYGASSPFAAERFLSELMNSYLAEKQAWKTSDASAAETFIAEQLRTAAKTGCRTKEVSRVPCQQPGCCARQQAEAMVGQIRTYEEQRVQSRLEVSGLRGIAKALKGSSSVEGYMMGEANDSVLVGMANSLAESKRKLGELESRFSAESPDVQSQKQQVDGQLRSIKSYVTSRLARAESNLGSLSSIIGQYEAKLQNCSGR